MTLDKDVLKMKKKIGYGK